MVIKTGRRVSSLEVDNGDSDTPDELRASHSVQSNSNNRSISGQPSNVASELTLLMLFPLIESQTKSDPSLKAKITELLTEFFQRAPPMSIKAKH